MSITCPEYTLCSALFLVCVKTRVYSKEEVPYLLFFLVLLIPGTENVIFLPSKTVIVPLFSCVVGDASFLLLVNNGASQNAHSLLY